MVIAIGTIGVSGKEARDIGEERADPVLPDEQIRLLDQRFSARSASTAATSVGTRPNTVSKASRVVAKGRCDRLKWSGVSTTMRS